MLNKRFENGINLVFGLDEPHIGNEIQGGISLGGREAESNPMFEAPRPAQDSGDIEQGSRVKVHFKV